jgi:hypothetical protein
MITLVKDPDAIPLEACCFCRKATCFWVDGLKGKDVACCPKCAKHANPEDVPTKRVWCRREAIAMGPRIGG